MFLFPTIVIVAFNRPKSLERLLESITNACYPDASIRLHISIDFSDSEAAEQVHQIACKFQWNKGEKLVCQQKTNLGLKQHILQCGDLTEVYQQIILLEDDLYVSPHFYSYAITALEYYQTAKKIAGISLYNYEICESLFLPFRPINDNSDIYFMQMPSSWGQAWTHTQWSDFRKWLAITPLEKTNQLLFNYAKKWDVDKSWKRHFIAYLVDKDLYFVFPRQSLSTNFKDAGTNIHRKDNNHLFQVNLLYEPKSFLFKTFEESKVIYDSFFEISPSALKQLNPILQNYDFDVDLKGGKKIKEMKKNYVLTSKKGKNPLVQFSNQLRPLAVNVIFNLPGDTIQLFRHQDLLEGDFMNHKYNLKTLRYLDYHLQDMHPIEFTFFKMVHPKYLWNVISSKLVDTWKRYFKLL